MDNLRIQREDVNRFFQGDWGNFYARFLDLKNGNGNECQALCPFHPDSDPSLSVNNSSGLFHCFGCGASGDAFTFYGLLKQVSGFSEILKGIAADFNIQASGLPHARSREGRKATKIVQSYDYTDETGKLLFQVVRFQPKDFRQRKPDGKGSWIWNMKGVNLVPYHLPEVLDAGRVFLPEGEKDADGLLSLGLGKGVAATTCPMGAGKWKDEYNRYFAGLEELIILPDNDAPGQQHAQQVAQSLKGTVKSIKILDLPGLPEKGDVTNWIEAGGTRDELERLLKECPEWEPDPDEEQTDLERMFPCGVFPWEVLPPAISDSLQQLARSCATSPTSLPGAAACIFASVIGSTVEVSPKRSWAEPLILWACDIRPSGAGKTPAARALCRVLYEAQTQADKEHKAALQEWQALPKKDRGEPPPRARGYFVTDLTLEGLREDHGGHGGKVCILDEVSAFVSAQNQYKKNKGSDRESWLALYDGKPARIVRAGKSITLSGARISIFGGVQPTIWSRIFGGEAGQFLTDGTIFRFLPTYGGNGFYPLTPEAWSDENRAVWEKLLRAAMRWADTHQEAGKRKVLCLDQEAQTLFLDWRNELTQTQEDLPPLVRGFIPKLVGYALRFAGVLYLMDTFNRGEEPGAILGVEDIRKGIQVAEFYLGHIIKAMQALTPDEAPEVTEMTPQVVHLTKTLEALRDEVDNGRLAVGHIQDRFDATCDRSLRVRSPHRMGALLRKCGLTIPAGRFHCNGKHGVRCLKWDEKTEMLVKRSPQSPHSEEKQEVIFEDFAKSKSSQVLKSSQQGENVRTLRTLKDQSPQGQVTEITGFEDNEDFEDFFSNVEEKNSELQDLEEVVL
ncbi:MAG: DUF3987 domain-containing protein [Deltaproteobacteria bacterium]|nr:DUF3987 domain-containing protein [Deltaproteobacteria bacterium]